MISPSCYNTVFSLVAAIVRMHLISILDMSELLRSTTRDNVIFRGSPRNRLQLILEFKEENEGVTLKNKIDIPCLKAIENKIHRLNNLVGQ